MSTPTQSNLTPPDRSLQQRRDALEEANRIRSYRASLKRDIGAGRTDVGELIRRVPAELETMKVYDLLLAIPKVGRKKASRRLNAARVSHSKTIGGLSPRQRAELLDNLPVAS